MERSISPANMTKAKPKAITETSRNSLLAESMPEPPPQKPVEVREKYKSSNPRRTTKTQTHT
jgi:hypothetical protein